MSKLRASRKQIYIKCPFYKGDDGKQCMIGCEGLLSDRSTEHFFPNKEEYLSFLMKYCEDKWEKCPFAKSLNQNKYADI